MTPNVERLVVRSQEGDARAFDLLVERFQRRVFYTILRVVRDTHLADDLTQEVFITVYRKLKDLKEVSSFPSWLLRMAMNKAIDSKRKTKREQERLFLVDDFTTVNTAEKGESSTESKAEQKDEQKRTKELEGRLREAIDELPKGQRKVLLLSMDKEMTQEEIASVLDIPKGTVKSRLYHARKFLTAKLRKVLEGV